MLPHFIPIFFLSVQQSNFCCGNYSFCKRCCCSTFNYIRTAKSNHKTVISIGGYFDWTACEPTYLSVILSTFIEEPHFRISRIFARVMVCRQIKEIQKHLNLVPHFIFVETIIKPCLMSNITPRLQLCVKPFITPYFITPRKFILRATPTPIHCSLL